MKLFKMEGKHIQIFYGVSSVFIFKSGKKSNAE